MICIREQSRSILVCHCTTTAATTAATTATTTWPDSDPCDDGTTWLHPSSRIQFTHNCHDLLVSGYLAHSCHVLEVWRRSAHTCHTYSSVWTLDPYLHKDIRLKVVMHTKYEDIWPIVIIPLLLKDLWAVCVIPLQYGDLWPP